MSEHAISRKGAGAAAQVDLSQGKLPKLSATASVHEFSQLRPADRLAVAEACVDRVNSVGAEKTSAQTEAVSSEACAELEAAQEAMLKTQAREYLAARGLPAKLVPLAGNVLWYQATAARVSTTPESNYYGTVNVAPIDWAKTYDSMLERFRGEMRAADRPVPTDEASLIREALF